jgi:tetratricopeptide (TPR) repeat protein
VGNTQVASPSASEELFKKKEVVPVEEKRLFSSEYKATADFWKNEVDVNPTNENAWISWYKAERYKNYTAHSKDISKSSQEVLNEIISKMTNSVPGSFALHYAMYLNAQKSTEAFESLKKANLIQPDNEELLDDLLALKVIEGDAAGAKKYSLEIAKRTPFKAPEMEYNRNVLNSVEPNAIILTNGNVDTYPIIIDQQISGLRMDVTVVCLEWLNNEKYAGQIAAKLGMSIQKLNSEKPYSALKEILNSSPKIPVYLALTLPPEQIEKYRKNLYLTGLAMKYSTSSIENIPSLVYNWENLFLKNQISSVHELNRNYLLPLIQLYSYYKNKGDIEKSDQVRSYILSIAKLTGQEDKIKNMVN